MPESELPVAARSRTALWLDLGCITALLVLAAMPLIVLRDLTRNEPPPFATVFCVLGGGLGMLWLALARRLRRTEPEATVPPNPVDAAGPWGWVEFTVASVLLLALTFVTFYQPMLKQFWQGYDDLMNINPVRAVGWDTIADVSGSRPLVFTLSALARIVFPGRIDAFLWLSLALWFTNALLLFAILRCFFPRASAVPWLAASLLVLNHGDPLRYLVMFGTNYYQTGLFFFQTGLWLFLVSSRRHSRSLLLGSCLFLGAALLCSESFFPLALLGPVLLWQTGRRDRTLVVWSFFWTGMMALLAVRFYLFLRFSAPYQTGIAQEAFRDPHNLWHSFVTKLSSIFSYFHLAGPLRPYRDSCLLAVCLAVGLGWLATRWTYAAGTSRWRLVAAAGLAALACLLGTLPFIPLYQSLARTLFLAAPAQAVLLACCLCWAVSFLPRLVGRLAVAACLGYVAVVTAAESHREQDASGPDRFAILAHVLDQLPRVSQDTLIVLVPENSDCAPLENFTVSEAARLSLGTPVYLATSSDPLRFGRITFERDGVEVQPPDYTGQDPYKRRYDQVVAFRLGSDWGLTLLRRLPAELSPEESRAESYDPLARIVPVPVPSPPYFRTPAGAERLFDLFDRDDGITLGEQWDRLKMDDGHLYRVANCDAELIVNPLGQERRQLCLELEPGPRHAGKPCPLDVVDEAGQVVASVTLLARQEVLLSVPTDPARMSVFRLRMRDGEPGAGDGSFRVFRRGGRFHSYRLPPEPPEDIVRDRLRLGKNWQGLEHAYLGKPVRWVDNDAELVVRSPGIATTLLLEVEPGPSLAGRAGELTIADKSGQVLATATLTGRQLVRIPLPPGRLKNLELRLHITNGGTPLPTDQRILNFLVLRAELSMEKAEEMGK